MLVSETKVGAMAFEDDLVVLAPSSGETSVLLEICEQFFDEKGLSANAKICASMRLLPVKGKRSMKVCTDVHRMWKGCAIPSISFEIYRSIWVLIFHHWVV